MGYFSGEFSEEFSGFFFGPSFVENTYPVSWLFDSKIEVKSIFQKFRQVEELRNKLFNVCSTALTGTQPGITDAIEQTVSMIKCPTLQLLIFLAERRQPNQIKQYTSSTRVMWPIMKSRDLRILPSFISAKHKKKLLHQNLMEKCAMMASYKWSIQSVIQIWRIQSKPIFTSFWTPAPAPDGEHPLACPGGGMSLGLRDQAPHCYSLSESMGTLGIV